MTATVVLKRGNRASWLRLRSQGLGGTDVAAVLGVSPFASAFETWLSKTGRAADVNVTYPMRRGTFMESFLLAEYARETGAIVEKPPALLAHPDYPMIRASLDGLAHHRDRTVILDAKAVGWRGREPWWDDTMLAPDHVVVQMLTYLAVTGLDEAVLVADVAGDFTTVTVGRDVEWEAIALPMLAQWWADYVVADVPPPADWNRDTIPNLNRAFVPVPGTTVEASQAVAGAVHAWQALNPAHKARGATLDALRVQIREGMGTAQTLTIGGEKAASLDSRGVLRVTNKSTTE
jgi:putative phage-type endonuclease